MIEFFRDVLDGPLYIVTTILSIIFIMAIIGFLMERKKLEKEEKMRVAVVGTSIPDIPKEVTPIVPVSIEEKNEIDTSLENPDPISNLNQEDNLYQEVKKPVIVFEDPDQKKE